MRTGFCILTRVVDWGPIFDPPTVQGQQIWHPLIKDSHIQHTLGPSSALPGKTYARSSSMVGLVMNQPSIHLEPWKYRKSIEFASSTNFPRIPNFTPLDTRISFKRRNASRYCLDKAALDFLCRQTHDNSNSGHCLTPRKLDNAAKGMHSAAWRVLPEGEVRHAANPDTSTRRRGCGIAGAPSKCTAALAARPDHGIPMGPHRL